MAFDQDAFIAATEPWSPRIGGVKYVSRPWSALQAHTFAEGWAKTNEIERAELWRAVLVRLFPWRLSYWWLGNPIKRFYAMSPELQRAAIADFFQHLARLHAPQKVSPKVSRPNSTGEVIDTRALFQSRGRLRTAKRTTDPTSSGTPADGEPTTDTSPKTPSGGTGG